ncbi:zinc finger and BTB domain-containing protein 21 [Arapaima gigas]
MTSNTKWMESRQPRAQHNSKAELRCGLRAAPEVNRTAKMENLVHYINPAHAISLLGVLNEQRLKGQLCDVILIVGDQKYEAHRSVLAASSEYFQSLFTRTDSEAHTVVQLDFCEPDAFENVLNYIYSSTLFVEKGSLAAIQELGYSLGIPFLTNIMSTKPQVSYSISRKRLSFSDEDNNHYQKKSVIVCQSSSNQTSSSTPHVKSLNRQGKTSNRQTPSVESNQALSVGPVRAPGYLPEYDDSNETLRSTASKPGSSTEASKNPTPSTSLACIPRGKAMDSSYTRPQLTSSVSLSESQIQHSSLQTESVSSRDESLTPLCNPRQSLAGRTGEGSQSVDRSGPLIKSLLRRSLSMDSPIPVFSPALELRAEKGREQSVVKMATKSTDVEPAEHNHQNSNTTQTLVCKHYSAYDAGDVHKSEVHVKTEPSSPLADPSEIIRITVGDNLPVNFRDFQVNFDEVPRGFFKHSGKRKARLDSRRTPCKKSKGKIESDVKTEDDKPTNLPHDSVLDDDNVRPESQQNQMFKCWNCLKVFRSNAGLYRHVNMYHNPEKPYSCEICHKRFHTNFKVWTHCQTQHGIIQNPAPSSSSYSLLDEKFQRKLIDIVREREIKKALIMKLRRNKQGSLQAQPFSKRSLRARSKTNVCPYCGKLFWFQSQFKQHLKMHPTEKPDSQSERKETMLQNQDQAVHPKENKSKEVYSCRLCNEKLTSLFEQGDHERGCRHVTVCPYCGLRFSSPTVKKEHETHCEYKKLTCLECMRTFKSSFSIWRHKVEVHNQNIMTAKDQRSQDQQDDSKVSDLIGPPDPTVAGGSKEDVVFSDSSGPVMFDSEESSFMPEDVSAAQSQGELRVKEEPEEEAIDEQARKDCGDTAMEECGVWPCEKCGKLFTSRRQLERHQELLCHIKPFICHICSKAFRTNFRLWSHFQSHMTGLEEPGGKEGGERHLSSPSPPPPLQTSTPNPALPRVGPQAGTKPLITAASAAQTPEPKKEDSCPLSKVDAAEKPLTSQESDTLFYHAPTLSALTFKRQYMCKLCHRTFKTAFSLWSHEQSHTNP